MKKNGQLSENRFRYLMFLLILMLFSLESMKAQCVVNSATGYSVNMLVVPKKVVASTTNCTWGYNFNYELDYIITFSGSNIPASVWTLQGNVIASGYSKNFYDLPNKGGSGTTTSVGNSSSSKSDCNTVTIASLNPSVEITIQGPGIPFQTINCPIGSLPVEVISFTGERMEDGISLHWSTASEVNNDYFSLERSSDAGSWSVIAEVNGAGNSNKITDYTVVDETPFNGINYYRLKQTDKNGRSVYSNMLTVDNSSRSTETTIYPNPTNGSTVTLRIATPSKGAIEAEVFNSMGQKIVSYNFPAETNLNQYTIDLPEAANMYLVNISQDNTIIGKHQVLVR